MCKMSICLVSQTNFFTFGIYPLTVNINDGMLAFTIGGAHYLMKRLVNKCLNVAGCQRNIQFQRKTTENFFQDLTSVTHSSVLEGALAVVMG